MNVKTPPERHVELGRACRVGMRVDRPAARGRKSVEPRLKKGLLGTGLRAYMNNLKAGRRKPKVYVVPCTISYALVLEAKTLIEDHLKEAGKSRYIIVDDEFSRLQRILEFMVELMRLDSRIYITFGQPLDPFGNRVDFQGRSLDGRGRTIDITPGLYSPSEATACTKGDRTCSEASGAMTRDTRT